MALMDEEIKNSIVDAIYRDPRINASDVSVEVDNGKVTLSGQVPTYFSFTATHSNALQIPGVVSVDNRLIVSYPPGVTIPAASELLSFVEDKLDRNPDIDIQDKEIKVTGGNVTLRGTVDAYWKKDYAETLVASEPGVLTITNNLAIVPDKDYLDQDVANGVSLSLESNPLVSSEDIDVRVQNGKVTLTGTVPSWPVWEAAHNSAVLTPGVRGVENLIVVSWPQL
ncbi:BON domain-containing protein [Desulfonatronovibrio magnus]|uniref:BON domain-containing protein n=1 Tax=Desulfonatronovibrio magnus TaxID=698827 RepID=UPI0005EAFC74|nr:BON domain-containing protein [Desulfonatronovibrio magnus]